MSRILIVEDEPSIAMALEDDLRREGYETELASDGEPRRSEGVRRFRPDLLDVMLPGQRRLRDLPGAAKRRHRYPIVLLTARAQEAEKVLGFEVGADDYVTKPYSARELRARVKAHLRRVSRQMPDVYRFGDAELDFTRWNCAAQAERIELSALEFKLLSAFVTRRTSSDAIICSTRSGAPTALTDRVVDNQVTNLRKKIEPDPERPRYLIALRGLGYRFDGEGVTDGDLDRFTADRAASSLRAGGYMTRLIALQQSYSG